MMELTEEQYDTLLIQEINEIISANESTRCNEPSDDMDAYYRGAIDALEQLADNLGLNLEPED